MTTEHFYKRNVVQVVNYGAEIAWYFCSEKWDYVYKANFFLRQ